jgi:hypothetical protein
MLRNLNICQQLLLVPKRAGGMCNKSASVQAFGHLAVGV